MATALIPRARVPEGITPDRLESDADLFEMIDGEILEKSSSAFSTWLTNRLCFELAAFVKQHEIGTVLQEMIFILHDGCLNRPRPDLAFVSAKRWPPGQLPPYHGYWQLTPNLAVEVASPTDRFEDVVEKANLYLDFGVEEVWLVVPRTRSVLSCRRNEVLAFTASDTLTTSLVPGWSLEVGKLIPSSSSEPDAAVV
jgi:Uma2 family endonuclease